jgi:hypothetical protein
MKSHLYTGTPAEVTPAEILPARRRMVQLHIQQNEEENAKYGDVHLCKTPGIIRYRVLLLAVQLKLGLCSSTLFTRLAVSTTG